MIKNDEGNHREGLGTRGLQNICFQKFGFCAELGRTHVPLLSNRNCSCFTDGVG